MGLVVKKKRSAPPLAEGTYVAILYCIADIGLQVDEKFKSSAQKVVLIWELVSETIDVNGEKKRRAQSQIYTQSLNKKSNLAKVVRTFLGRDLTSDEEDGIDLAQFVGSPCMLSISVNESDDGEAYNKIDAVVPLPKGLPAPTPENELITYDMDASPDEVLQKLPEWVRDKIAKAQGYNAKTANSVDVKFNDLPDPIDVAEVSETVETMETMGTMGIDEDDIP